MNPKDSQCAQRRPWAVLRTRPSLGGPWFEHGLQSLLGRSTVTTAVFRSTRDISYPQDVRLKLQILQSMLDYIADADDTG